MNYDSFESLPADVQRQIVTLIEPADPEVWVKTPVQALDARSFLDAINSEGGNEVVSRYFEQIEAFERKIQPSATEDLGRIFHFDQADLDSNRAGLLSPIQRQRLWRQDMLRIVGAAVCLFAGVMFNIVLLVGWMSVHGRGAALGVSLILLGLILAVWSAETWLDLAPGSVLVAEGRLRPTERVVTGRYGARTVYCFEIGGQTFDVPKQAHDEVREGNRRLYYLRRTRTVLSLDPPTT